MPLRGESVGTAYVKILADGSDLDRSIRGELDDIDKEFDEKGTEHAKKYDRAAEKELRKGAPRNAAAIDMMFEKHGAKARALAREIDSELFSELDKSIRQGHGEILGDRIMRDIRKGFVEGGGYAAFGKNFEHLFDQLPGMVEKANREITRENAQMEKDRTTRFNQSVTEITAGYNRILRGSKNSTTGQHDNIGKTIQDLRRLRNELDHIPSLGDNDRGETARLLRDMERGLDRIHPRLRALSGTLDRSSEGMGRLFGKGSRNNFLNFTGVVVEGIGKVISKGPKMVESLLNVPKKFEEMRETASSFFKVFTEGLKVTGPLEAFQGALGSLEGAGSGLLSSISAGVIAIPVLVAAIGTVVAAGSLLIGVVVALASSLSFALVGALGAVVGALLPVAAGIGVLVAGIASMSDAQKKALSGAIKPFVSGMKDIGKSVADSIFGLDTPFKNTIDNMTHALTSSNIKDIATDIGRTIGGIGNSWSIALNSPGFQNWIKAMDKTLPGQMVSLGNVTKNIVTAIGNIFLALQPIVSDFTTWLDKITTKFADWTGTKEGQKSMLDFFARAETSIKSVGHFLHEVVGLMGDLLFNSEGQKTGNSLFDSMADGIKRFRDYIADGGLEKWFKDAKDFGEKLGDTIVGIGKVLDDLDSPGFRSFAKFSLDTFNTLFYVIGLIIKPVNDLVQSFHDLFTLDWDAFGKSSSDLTDSLLNLLTLGLWDKVGDWWSSVDWSGIAGDIVDGFWGGLKDFFGPVVDWFGSLPQKFVDAFITPLGIHSPSTVFAGFGMDIMLGLLQGLLGFVPQVVGFFLGLGGQMLGAMGGLLVQFAQFGANLIGNVVGGIGSGVANAVNFVGGVASGIASKFSSVIGPAFDGLRNKGADLGNFLKGGLSGAFHAAQDAGRNMGNLLAGAVSSAASGLRDKASSLGNMFKSTLSGAFHTAGSAANAVRDAISGIGSKISWVIDKVKSLISWLGNIHVPHLDPGGGIPFVPGIKTGGIVDPFGLHRIKKMAAGGLANFAQRYQIGEAGREAIVPLDRPLGQVDPAVRLLSAFAQGKLGNVSTDASKSIDASGWQIITPTDDPVAVAQEVLDALTAKIV